MMNRRDFMAAAAAATAVGLAFPALGRASPDFSGVTLRVHTWGGTWRDSLRDFIGKQFEAAGGSVEYTVGAPQAAFAKMIASRGQSEPPFDVVEMSDHNRREWTDAGFLADLNYENLPNAQAMPDERFRLQNLVSPSRTLDGIVWNREVFAEKGLAEPASYQDLQSPELGGFVSFPDIATVHAFKALVGISHELGGSEQDIDPALQFVRELDPQFFWKSAVDLLAKFQSGDVWAAPLHAGHVVRGRRGGLPLEISYPQVGESRGVSSATWVGVMAGSKHQEAAEFFINTYLEAEAQLEFCIACGLVPQNPEAAQRLAEIPEQAEVLSYENLDGFYYPPFGEISAPEWTRQWNSVVL